ncbi:LuxR family transcriptional regulator [Arthrobacter sp. zg-Y1171]|uniref:helix-turn-helix transcriptional regulator n=1 Tax=unclassified Arthrobacter TaxID=235627 RepID=UPI00210772FA|nr:LuxR family transcriptional regulator [Arthrobacter sp. zg-Y1171]MCQ1947836.1 LuxR C-terminal-related transcriptional regulator [Arthrobacter sp. zg-Y1116]MCQ1987775.1 LuxR C-terminal-related transcriptional regulator [Arthrobacter sp. zg-Y844]MCQ1996260.1 LuxR C-terminal-related transcriptional regulator [Arthrobacter sp. zg-Y1171]UWX82689.1 LuxR C-terminal-related transcriptional regulator [Arthrobacter sp. zg-Y1171]
MQPHEDQPAFPVLTAADTPDAAAGTGARQQAQPAVVGREQVLEEILRNLSGGAQGTGCLLVGEAGIGKTAVMQHVLRNLQEDTYIVQVRGSVFAGRTPFGALTFLLSDLDPELSSHPVMILRGLTQLVSERSGGRPVLLSVDNAEELDEFSAMVLTQMVLNRSAGMLVAFRDFSSAPAEFAGLWRDGILERVDLEPLSVPETAAYLGSLLGGTVSRAAAAAVHDHAGGNPHLLALARTDFQDAGRLKLHNGTWILAPGEEIRGGRVASAVMGNLSDLPPAQTNLLQLLSMAQSLPLPVVLARLDSADLDALQEKGIVTLDARPVVDVLISNPVVARSVRASLTPARQRQLFEELAPALNTGLVLDPLVLARWLSAIGEAPSLELVLRAARLATASGQPETAVRLLSEVTDGEESAGAVVELARARTAQGEYGAAMGVLARFRGSESVPSGQDRIRLLLAEGKVMCIEATGLRDPRSAETPAEPARMRHTDLFEQAEQEIADLRDNGGDVADLVRELALARAECHSAHGRFVANATYLADLELPDAGFRILRAAWQAEAWSMTNRQDDAVEQAGKVERLLQGTELTAGTRARVVSRLLHTYALTGALPACERLLERSAAEGMEGTYAELAEGLLHAFAGRPEPALAALTPGVSQLTVSGPAAFLPLAAAAAAYCHAVEGRSEEARRYLQVQRSAADGGPWTVRRGARHFAALTEAALGSETGSSRFSSLAAQDHRRGAYAYELLARFTAMRLGDEESLDDVLSVAANLEGDFASLCELYAKGLGNGDAQVLLRASEVAAGVGHVLLAREISEHALSIASGAGDRATVRFIHRSRRVAAPDSPAEAADEFLGALTARERSIARKAVAGTSNKKIAEELGISVRTVEGHLYQVYSKLHVGSRRELARTIAEQSGAKK